MAVTLVMFFLGFLLDEQAGLAAQSMRALHAPKARLTGYAVGRSRPRPGRGTPLGSSECTWR